MRKLKLKNHYILIFTIVCVVILGLKLFLSDKNKNYQMEDYEKYALAGSVNILLSDTKEYIKVLSCYPEDKSIKLVIESNISVDINTMDINSLFHIVDDNKNKGKLIVEDVFYNESHNSSEYKWLISASLLMKDEPHRLSLEYDEYSMPIILINNESNNIHRNTFNITQISDIKIAAFTKYYNNLLKITIVPAMLDNKIISNNLIVKDIALIDKEGNSLKPIIEDNNTFYFKAKISDIQHLDIYSIDIYNKEIGDKKFDEPNSFFGSWSILLR